MAEKKKNSKAKSKVAQVLNQAKESLKILQTLEKETIAKARSFVKIPGPAERKRLTNEKILSSLKKIGVATHSEIAALQEKLRQLEIKVQQSTEGHRPRHSNGHSKSTVTGQA